MIKNIVIVFILLVNIVACNAQTIQKNILPGAYNLEEYLPLIQNQNIGLVVNQSSIVEQKHLLDTLLACNVNVLKVFAPEHGFRGVKDAGEHIDNDIDQKTGVPIISLYGKNRKPDLEQLKGLDVIIFDIQDVGVRFYTYISTMHYMMEACAQADIKFVVLDRPNPNGNYFDGPVLEKEYKSFVGMHPIPIVHGLTVGELAQMINGEYWLKDSLQCNLKVVKVKNWNHNTPYDLPVKPSPNLPNTLSIRLYPSLCFFEATNISIGRGTYFPFQVIGYPDSECGEFSFTPKSIDGMSKHPKQENVTCYGIDLRSESLQHQFTLQYFIEFYNRLKNKDKFTFDKRWFNLLAGNTQLYNDIVNGLDEEQIRFKWQDSLQKYSLLRDKYLLYSKED